jgi:hypothetical protein
MPSVNYQQVGISVDVNVSRWHTQERTAWCVLDLKLEHSGISRSGVIRIPSGIDQPTFTRRQAAGRILLESGRPVFLAWQGAPSPSDPQGKTAVTLVRLTAVRLGQ